MEPVKEINESFQEIEQTVINEESEVKDEPKSDGEDEMIIPDVSDVADVDPLEIESIKQEELVKDSHNSKAAFELWSKDRRLELRTKFPELTRYRITLLLNKEWETLPDVVKQIWYDRVKLTGPRTVKIPLKPTRQSNRPRKPKEMKVLPELEKVKKKQTKPKSSNPYRPFQRPGVTTITLYPEHFTQEQIMEIEKKQNEEKEKRKKPVNINRRYTAYTLWAKEIGEMLRLKYPKMTFIETSKRLSQMWRDLSALEKYNFRRRAKRLNDKIVIAQPDTKEEKNRGDAVQVSSKGRVLAKSKKLENFCMFDDKSEKIYRKSVVLVPFSVDSNKKVDTISDSQIEKEGRKKRFKSP
ncbi:high mobility group B protein 13-like [Belonocnema kinseyi]|uniref:high mobility group B protein 13-like n=1 Tax=Belonocnema kinseyi TaxID=2817044 RepID=UPI00143CD181|nr:high mobility group B protein 13-like [Belonocnema kinseyi]